MAGLAAGALLPLILAGCVAGESARSPGYRNSGAQATVVVQDDYDYYPGYEVYYSRNRHEYVYRDGNAWVRQPEPRGVAVNVLQASPSVRLDFHDAPERHHASVTQAYPKSWKPGEEKKGDDRKGPNDRPGN